MQQAALKAETTVPVPHLQTIVSRNLRGELRAVTEVALYDDFVLEVYTNKGASGVLVTRGWVHKVRGNSKTHRIYQDYSAALAHSEHRRVTEKLISQQHAEVLLNIEAIKAKAIEHTKKVEAGSAVN